MAIGRCRLTKSGDALGHAAHIAFIGNNDLRALGKLGGIRGKLIVDNAIVLKRISVFKTTGNIDNVQDKRGALDMAKELMA